ncbi:MAG: signal recognition particle-docking protein FtsY, partial [Muribaculaceae bacterium]|nr:signal recognition particle-docking protein FtsY [Muribaculaceae bacterium]
MGFFKKIFSKEKKEILDSGLQMTKEGVWSKITKAVAGKSKIDDDVLDELEEVFLTSDLGVDTTLELIKRLEERVARDKYVTTADLHNLLAEEIITMIEPNIKESELDDFQVSADSKPYVILVVGVNGVGKTTTVGKLAHQYAKAGNKVFLAASDTYRAAAIEQLQTWGDRADCTVIKQKMGSDPAAVAFDTVCAAKAQGADVVIIDTAGRLHNKANLMRELEKISKVVKRVVPDAPQEVLLVLDGGTGQNAYLQAEQFAAVTNINALAVTKLDGTAKGGVVIGISHKHKIPIKYIGLREKMED